MPNVLKNKPRHKVDEQEITRFNWKRENCAGIQFNASEFKELLKSMGYATSGNWIKCICDGENPPFIRVSRGQYVFNPKPVYIERLQTVWDAYANYGKRSSSHLDEKQLKLDIDNAVKLLKNLGYRVLKPVTQYEEVLKSYVHRRNTGDNPSIRILSFITFSECGEKRECVRKC